MPLLPKSLFSRLLLTLLALLVATHVAVALLLLHERGQVFYRAVGFQIAQRVGAVTTLLEGKGTVERRQIVDAFQGGLLHIELDRHPRLADTADDEDWRTTLFRGLVERRVGRRPIHIAIEADGATLPPPDRPPPYGMGRGMGRHMGGWGAGVGLGRPGVSFQAEVQLGDGQWVRFRRVLPEEALDQPLQMLAAVALLLLAVAAVSALAVRWLVGPLTTLARAADELGRDIQRPPLPEEGPEELRRAARAFNTMQQRIVRYVEDHGRLLAAVSHDLKTPITRLRLRTELLEEEATREKFRGDLEEMERMVGATLDFMRGLDEKEPKRPVELRALLESLQEEFESLYPDPIALRGEAAAPYPARPTALKRCLRNLIENGLKYGGAVEIGVEDDAERLTLHIFDRGPGIPEELIEGLFEPFRRLEESRARDTGGTGLGLGIARNIARAHGGEVTLHNRPDGGLEARVVLPRRVD
ncbi:ATP-binding protein [Endothiovibrio diazotrophicus]